MQKNKHIRDLRKYKSFGYTVKAGRVTGGSIRSDLSHVPLSHRSHELTTLSIMYIIP